MADRRELQQREEHYDDGTPVKGQDGEQPAPADRADEPEVELDDVRQDSWNTWIIELVVVMALAWLVPMVAAITSDAMTAPPELWFGEVWLDEWSSIRGELWSITASLQVLLPLLYIVWRSDASWREVGIVRLRLFHLLLLGPLLAAMAFGVDLLVDGAWQTEATPDFVIIPEHTLGWSILIVSLVFNSLAEEFVWRGFVLHRLTQMSGSKLFALGVSSILFGAYHLYQGPFAAGAIFVGAVIWGAAVLLTRSIWPAVVAHTILNIVYYASLAESWTP